MLPLRCTLADVARILTVLAGDPTYPERRRVGPTRGTAELDVSPVGLPVRAHGLGTIAETSPGTTRMVLTWRVESNLPVIGHKIERLFAELIRTSLVDADHAFTLRYLEA